MGNSKINFGLRCQNKFWNPLKDKTVFSILGSAVFFDLESKIYFGKRPN